MVRCGKLGHRVTCMVPWQAGLSVGFMAGVYMVDMRGSIYCIVERG